CARRRPPTDVPGQGPSTCAVGVGFEPTVTRAMMVFTIVRELDSPIETSAECRPEASSDGYLAGFLNFCSSSPVIQGK
ncbi:hypothetical protein ACFVZL_43635, partial [Streptomyces sp. NPDC058320]|uniref:hypothetical protein n=1 Tax=Streptomyces sp. NPDC058320 TaxID=3346444 RepID=UPI0036EBCC93